MQWLAEICIKRPVFATMLIMSVIVVGAVAYTTLGVDRLPNVDVPTISVTVSNEGAAPAEIETEITQILEDSLNTISGLDTMTSTSTEGQSQITVKFDLDKDVDTAAQDVRDKINLVTAQLPTTAKDPIVQKRDPDSQPILQIAVSADVSQKELYEIADNQIKDQIENVTGVSDVSIIGGGEREIQILLDPDKMRSFNVTASDVTAALQKQNQETPGGRLTQGANEITVRTVGKVTDVADFNNIAVIKRDNYAVLLSDIAEVRDSTVELRSLALLNGKTALTVQILKQSGTNTLTVVNEVKERLATVQKSLGDKVKMTVVSDQSTFIQASFDTVEEHLIIGSILACLVVFIFLGNLRMTLIAAIAIPTSIIGTFAVMYMLDYTLNMITMLALTLMVGIVIDDAIIVLENIYHFMERGFSPLEAAKKGTEEIGLAVLATTLSLLAVFIPVGFMSGMVGRFTGSFGLTASAAIAISLFVAFALTPMLCSRFIKIKQKKSKSAVPEFDFENEGEDVQINNDSENDAKKQTFWEKLKTKDHFKPIADFYVLMLRWSMRHRWVIVLICGGVLLSNILLFSIIGIDFIPTDDESAFQVSIETPEGSTLPATTTVAERIAKDMRNLPGVTDTLTTVGSSSSTSSVNSASIYVKLTDIDKRELSQNELSAKAREILKQYPPELKTNVRAAGGFGSSYSVQYTLLGPDLTKLTAYSDEIVKQLEQDPNATDVGSSLAQTKPELRIEVDRRRAADLGVSVQDVSQALNILLTGSVATTFNTGEDQYDVRVRANGIFRQTLEDLKQISVRSEQNEIISLDQLVKIENGTAAATIERYNRQRQVTIYSNVKDGSSSSEVSANLTQIVNSLNLPAAYQTQQSGSSRNMSEAIYYFGLAFLMSFIFMYMVLASQFESFIHPVTILMTLPLAIPFGLLCLILTGQSLNLFSMLGVLVLFGIVKKNAILQIDHTNQLRERGINRYEAIIQANRDRLRPILMTTIAFVAGMIPLLITTGAGSTTNRSIGTLVAGGQTLCLLLTLLAVPVFYSIWDDIGKHPFFRKAAARMRLLKRGFKRRFVKPAWSGLKRVFGTKTSTAAGILLLGLICLSGVTFAQTQKTEIAAVKVSDKTSEKTSDNIETAKSTENAEKKKTEIVSVEKKEAESAEEKPIDSSENLILKTVVKPVDFSRVGVSPAETMPLSLQEAIKLALAQNNDIKESETDVKIAEFSLRSAFGAYDPQFVTENYFERATTPSASSLLGANSITESSFSTVTGINGKVTKFGGSYSAQFSTSRVGSSSALTTLNPQYPSSLTLSYTQPLFRGLKTDETRRAIAVAKKNISLTDAQFRQQVITTISNVETAYWNLTYALKNLQVQQNAAKDAQAQLESTERQVEQGVIAPVDIVQTQNQLVTIQQNIYTAKELVTTYENTLKSLILSNREDTAWSRELMPTSNLTLEIPRITLPEAIESALKNRPELAQLAISREINKINTNYYKDQTKPQIDLIGSYTSQGLAGTSLDGFNSNSALTDRVNQLSTLAGLPILNTTTTSATSSLNGRLFSSYGDLLSQKYPTYRVGVTITLPFGNRTAKANYGSSLAESDKLEYQTAQQKQLVETEVRNALETLNAAENRYKLAVQSRELTQKLYDSERRQFLAGTSTTYLVLERQTALVQAQAAEIQAQTSLNEAIANLRTVTGGSLEANGITLR